jgi:hypothetical protein
MPQHGHLREDIDGKIFKYDVQTFTNKCLSELYGMTTAAISTSSEAAPTP